ncbi:unnamed protein product [Symbiodinium sp. CCMP2592]|nr:unnamed protein product [Symbiodinium sp. CCMP2592]
MSHALEPFVSEDIENGDEQTPETAAEHRPSCKWAAGGVLLLMIACCMGLWMGGRASHFDPPHTLHGPDFINFESIRAEDEFLNLGPGSVCRGDKVDAHLGPTGKEGMVLSNTNPKKDGVSPEKCEERCAEWSECKGYELGPEKEQRCELWVGLTHHEDLFEHNTVYNNYKALKMHEKHSPLAEYHCVLKVSHDSFTSQFDRLAEGCKNDMVERHAHVLRGRHANFSLTCESEVGAPGHQHWHPHQCLSRRNNSIINAVKRLDQLMQNCAKPLAKQIVEPTAKAKPSPTQEPRPVAKPAAGGVNWLLIAIIVACVLGLGALAAMSQHPAVQAAIFGPPNTGLPNLMGSQPGGKGPRDAGTGYNPVDN